MNKPASERAELTLAGYRFVITYGSGPGCHGSLGYLASLRPLHQSRGAIKIGGSPFKAFADAEDACNAMPKNLTGKS